MATPRWPSTLSQQPDPNGGWVRTPRQSTIASPPDVGPDVVRRRGTARMHDYQATFPPFTDAELAIFEAFFEDDLKDGSLHYLWLDPQSGTDFKWRIKGYSVSSTGAGLHHLTAQLTRLPGAAV